VSGTVDAHTPGIISLLETGQGNTETDIGWSQSSLSSASIPPDYTPWLGLSVVLGNVRYDLTSLTLLIKGEANAEVTNPQLATGIYLDYHVSANLLGTSQSATTEIGPCGGEFLTCSGVHQSWDLTLFSLPALPLANFDITLEERAILNTTGTSSPVTVNAQDPFNITAIDLLDANGQILPGVSFTGPGGYVFPTDAPPLPGTDVPEPASFVLLGIGFVGLAGLRRTGRR
jgi:hypothetical protein